MENESNLIQGEDGHANENTIPSNQLVMGHIGSLSPALMAANQFFPGMQQKSRDKPVVRQKFTQEEDDHLKMLVEQYGVNDWKNISSLMTNRSQRQCRERWKNYLSPDVSNAPWTTQEDILLEEKHRELGPQWSRIAKFFPCRTDIHVKNRWVTLSNKLKNMRHTDNAQN